MIFPGSGVPSRTGPEVIGGFLDKNDTVSNEPFEGWRAIVSKGADNFFVVVTVIGEAVGFNHGPVGEVREQEVR